MTERLKEDELAIQHESALCHRPPASSGQSSARAQQRKESLTLSVYPGAFVSGVDD